MNLNSHCTNLSLFINANGMKHCTSLESKEVEELVQSAGLAASSICEEDMAQELQVSQVGRAQNQSFSRIESENWLGEDLSVRSTTVPTFLKREFELTSRMPVDLFEGEEKTSWLPNLASPYKECATGEKGVSSEEKTFAGIIMLSVRRSERKVVHYPRVNEPQKIQSWKVLSQAVLDLY